MISEQNHSFDDYGKPNFRNTRLKFCVSASICMFFQLISYCVTFNELNKLDGHDIFALSRSTLFYARSDARSTKLAQLLTSIGHGRSIDLLAPNAGKSVFDLTGSYSAVSPTLVVPTAVSNNIESGAFAVEKALYPLTTSLSPARKGKRALLWMCALTFTALLFIRELGNLASVFPLIGTIAILAIGAVCVRCGVGTSFVSTIAPILGLLYLALGYLAFTDSRTKNRNFYIGFACISAFVPTFQSYMISLEPKLCPACLLITFISVLYFLITVRTLICGAIVGLALPRKFRTLTGASWILTATRVLLLLLGVVKLNAEAQESVPSFVGQPISQYIGSNTLLAPGEIILVTLKGCHACESAKAGMKSLRLVCREIPVCTMARSQACFDGNGLHFPAPLITNQAIVD